MNMKHHGFGISSTTISPDPFHTYTKTPDARHVRMSPKDMDASGMPTMEANEVAPPPRHHGNGAPPPVSAVEYHLRAGLQNAKFAEMLHADNQNDPTKNYLALLDNPAYFSFIESPAASPQTRDDRRSSNRSTRTNAFSWFGSGKRSDASEASFRSAKSTRSDASEASFRSAKSTRSDASEASFRSANSALSDASEASFRSVNSALSDASEASFRSVSSALSDASAASFRSANSALSDASEASFRSVGSARSDASEASSRSVSSARSDASEASSRSAKSTRSDASKASSRSAKSTRSDASKASSRAAESIPLGMLMAKDDLIEQLEAVRAKLGDSLKLPREMKGADMVVLTQAVAQACRGYPPRLAARGLECLSKVDLHGSIAHPATSCPDGFDGQELACAWRIAQALEETPLGFAALKKIAQQHSYPNLAACASEGKAPPVLNEEQAKKCQIMSIVVRHDDTMLHAFLRASREKGRLDEKLSAHPQAIFDSIPNNPSKLLDKSLRAAQAHMKQSQEYLAHTPVAPFTATRDVNEWAIGAVVNGFYTDDKKDEHGNPTPFHKAEQRLQKMSKWVSRASGTNNKDPDGSHTDVVGKDASKLRKFSRFMRNTLLPGMKKSPFNALNRRAPDSLPYVGATPGGAFRNSEGGGLGEARAINEMVVILKAELEGRAKAHKARLDRGAPLDEEMLRDMVRWQILKQVFDDTKGMWRYVNCGLNDTTRTKAKQEVYKLLTGRERGQTRETKNFINGLIDNKHSNLTPETLVEWALDAGCPKDHIPKADPMRAAGQPDWHAFKLAQKRATEPVRPTETPNLKTVSKAQVAQIIADGTKNHELSSRVTFYSGGVAGVGTKQLTTLFGRLISKGVLKVNADGRAEGTRCATVEIGTGSQGNELFLGTQRIAKGQVGGGVGVGWKVNTDDDHVIQAGVNASAAAGMEFQDRNGVMIRFDRIGGGVGTDKAANAKLARLAGKLIAPGALPEGVPYANAQGEDGKSPLKNLWQEWPEVSVSLVETKENAGRASKSVSGGLGFKFGSFSLGAPNIGSGIEGKKGKSAWRETGGSLRVDKNTKYWTAKTNASASAAVGGIVGTSGDNVDLGLNADVAGANVDFWKNGYNQTDVLIEHQGALQSASVRIKTYQTFQAFLDKVGPELDKWTEEKAMRFYKKEYYGESQQEESIEAERQRIETRNAALEAEHTRLSQFIRQAKDTAEPTQCFWEFKELSAPATAAANALQSVAHGAAKCGDRTTAQECTKSRDKMLDSEEAWERSYLVSSEVTSEQRTMTPVNFFFKSAQVDGIIAANIKTFT